MLKSDVIEFERSRGLDFQHYLLEEQQKLEKKRKKKKEYNKNKKIKEEEIQRDVPFDHQLVKLSKVLKDTDDQAKRVLKRVYQPSVKDKDAMGKITAFLQGRFDSKIKECEHF